MIYFLIKIIMECYICFQEYTMEKTGFPCFLCNKTCCGNCYVKMFIISKKMPKCGLCRYEKNPKKWQQKTINLCTELLAKKCGLTDLEIQNLQKKQ
jgi:hypothetical protein